MNIRYEMGTGERIITVALKGFAHFVKVKNLFFFT